MIPKIIHYCWFGRGEMPELAKDCIASWKKHMPDYELRLWNEENFDVNNSVPYVKEAYEAKKYAFVSDYVRLLALNEWGGIYMDVDFEVYKPFDDLLHLDAFAGFEGSKRKPLMMGCIASNKNGIWVKEQLDSYRNRHFTLEGKLDLRSNVDVITTQMEKKGFRCNGEAQTYEDLHVFPVEYFCGRLTTGESVVDKNTYCEHRGVGKSSWKEKDYKDIIHMIVGDRVMTRLIKIKRKLIG